MSYLSWLFPQISHFNREVNHYSARFLGLELSNDQLRATMHFLSSYFLKSVFVRRRMQNPRVLFKVSPSFLLEEISQNRESLKNKANWRGGSGLGSDTRIGPDDGGLRAEPRSSHCTRVLRTRCGRRSRERVRSSRSIRSLEKNPWYDGAGPIEAMLGGPDHVVARVGTCANSSLVAAQMPHVRETSPKTWARGSVRHSGQGHRDDEVIEYIMGSREEAWCVRGWLGDVDVSGSGRRVATVPRYFIDRYGFEPGRNADVPRGTYQRTCTSNHGAHSTCLVSVVPPGGSIGLDDKLLSFWLLQGDSHPLSHVKGIFRFETSVKVNEFRIRLILITLHEYSLRVLRPISPLVASLRNFGGVYTLRDGFGARSGTGRGSFEEEVRRLLPMHRVTSGGTPVRTHVGGETPAGSGANTSYGNRCTGFGAAVLEEEEEDALEKKMERPGGDGFGEGELAARLRTATGSSMATTTVVRFPRQPLRHLKLERSNTSSDGESAATVTAATLMPVTALPTSKAETQVGLAKVAEPDVDAFVAYTAVVPRVLSTGRDAGEGAGVGDGCVALCPCSLACEVIVTCSSKKERRKQKGWRHLYHTYPLHIHARSRVVTLQRYVRHDPYGIHNLNHLSLVSSPRKLGAPDPTCFLTGTSLLTWNQVGVHARLAHLRNNAGFVRELRIVDWGQSLGKVCLGVEPGPAPFDPTSPANVSFDGSFTFPSALEPLPSVRSLSLRASDEAVRVVEAVRPELLDISLEATDQKGYCFKDVFRPYPSLKQLDIRFGYYGDWIPCGYFDFTTYPEDARIAIQMKVPDCETYIEAPGAWAATEKHLKRVFVDDFAKLDVRRDDGSDTFVISRPAPGRVVGVRDLHLLERDEDKEAVLGFEQAVLAALPNQQLLDGPIDAGFWDRLDGLFAKVYTQTFEALAA
ncbi:hypothetical protein BJY52DRAFT_1227856 [Lactarius psammicola]|nr:hypothetical protein BJY52DRAFT_1227856 [Lactarius psammicola]